MSYKSENRFNIYDYLCDEFLNADSKTYVAIADFYCSQYGVGAYNYMQRTYYSWKRGHTGISSQTMYRIVECVPKFLTIEKRLYILRCEIHNFIEKAKSKLKKHHINTENLFSIYETLQKEIINFNEANLHWFIGKNIFEKEHIEHYLSICKYALNQRLIQSYEQVIGDLNLITEKFYEFNRPINTAQYKIDFLGITFEIHNLLNETFEYSPLQTYNLNLNDSFKKFGEQYILDEVMKMSLYEKEGKVNASIKSQDIDFFFNHYNELATQENEIKMNSVFQGDGGQLTMNLYFVPWKKSLSIILFSSSKVIGIIGAIVLVILLSIKYNFKGAVGFLVCGGYILAFYLIGQVGKEIQTIYKELNRKK